MRLLTILLLLAVASAANGQVRDFEPPAYSVMQSGGVTLAEAVERVRRQYNGRIVKAETRCSGDREMHVIKVVTQDGTVKTVRIPGKRCG